MKNDVRRVKFTTRHGAYLEGDVAEFPIDIADEIIAIGHGVEIERVPPPQADVATGAPAAAVSVPSKVTKPATPAKEK